MTYNRPEIVSGQTVMTKAFWENVLDGIDASGQGESLAPTSTVASRAPSKWLTTFQPGHGWLHTLGGDGVIADDASRSLIGSQSLKVTNGSAQKSGLALDLTGRALTVMMRYDEIPVGSNITIYAGSAGMTSFKSWEIRAGNDPSPWFSPGEWVTLAFAWEAAGSTTGTPDRAAIDTIRIRSSPSSSSPAVVFNVQAIGSSLVSAQRSAVTFSFDDGWSSTMLGAKTLASRGISGTVYAIPEMVGKPGFLTLPEYKILQDLYRWDIQSHGEPIQTSLSEPALRAEMRSIKAWMVANGFGRGDHLAYPGGKTNASVIAVAREFFSSARTIANGGQLETWPPADPYRLRAASSISGAAGGRSVAQVKTIIDKAASGPGQWAILTFHRITEGAASTTMDCSAADLAEIADYALAADVDILTTVDALARPR